MPPPSKIVLSMMSKAEQQTHEGETTATFAQSFSFGFGSGGGSMYIICTDPLARNQYMNDSPGIFPVFARVRIQPHRNEFPQELRKYVKNDSSNIASCIRASANTGPTCIPAKNEFTRNICLNVLVLCRGGRGKPLAVVRKSSQIEGLDFRHFSGTCAYNHRGPASLKPPKHSPPT